MSHETYVAGCAEEFVGFVDIKFMAPRCDARWRRGEESGDRDPFAPTTWIIASFPCCQMKNGFIK